MGSGAVALAAQDVCNSLTLKQVCGVHSAAIDEMQASWSGGNVGFRPGRPERFLHPALIAGALPTETAREQSHAGRKVESFPFWKRGLDRSPVAAAGTGL